MSKKRRLRSMGQRQKRNLIALYTVGISLVGLAAYTIVLSPVLGSLGVFSLLAGLTVLASN